MQNFKQFLLDNDYDPSNKLRHIKNKLRTIVYQHSFQHMVKKAPAIIEKEIQRLKNLVETYIKNSRQLIAEANTRHINFLLAYHDKKRPIKKKDEELRGKARSNYAKYVEKIEQDIEKAVEFYKAEEHNCTKQRNVFLEKIDQSTVVKPPSLDEALAAIGATAPMSKSTASQKSSENDSGYEESDDALSSESIKSFRQFLLDNDYDPDNQWKQTKKTLSLLQYRRGGRKLFLQRAVNKISEEKKIFHEITIDYMIFLNAQMIQAKTLNSEQKKLIKDHKDKLLAEEKKYKQLMSEQNTTVTETNNPWIQYMQDALQMEQEQDAYCKQTLKEIEKNAQKAVEFHESTMQMWQDKEQYFVNTLSDYIKKNHGMKR